MWLFMHVAASSGVPTFCLKDAPIILSDIILKPLSLTRFDIPRADTCIELVD